MTFEYLLKQKNPVLRKRVDVMKYNAKHNWLRSLGGNGFEHSKKIEGYLDELVPDDIKEEEFCPGEIFVLLYAVYLHDIGLLEGRENHEKNSYEDIMKNFREYGLDDEHRAEAVAIVCRGHASEEEYPLKNIPDNFGVDKLGLLNPRFLAALLRLADEIDNAYTRVIGYPDETESMRRLVRFVEIDIQHWLICFQTKPENIDEWEELVGIRSYTQKRLNELIWVIKPKGLLYDRVELKPKEVLEIEVTVDGTKRTGPISADECAEGRCELRAVVRDSEGRKAKTDLPEVDWSCQYSDNGTVRESSRAHKDKAAKTPSEETGQGAVCRFTRTTAGIWRVQAELVGIHEITPGKTTIEVDRGEVDGFDIRLSPKSRGKIRDGMLIVPKGGEVVFEGVAWDKHSNLGPIPEEVANEIRLFHLCDGQVCRGG